MFKIISIVFLVTTHNLLSQIYSNKNFLITRAPGKDFYQRHSGFFETKRDVDNNFLGVKAALSSYGFYSKMINTNKTAAYFGVKAKTGSITYSGGRATGKDLDSTTFIHNAITDRYIFTLNDSSTKDILYYRYNKPSQAFPDGSVSYFQIAKRNASNNGNNPPTPVTEVPGPTNDVEKNLSFAFIDYESSVTLPKALSGSFSLTPFYELAGMTLSLYSCLQNNFWAEFCIPIISIKQGLLINAGEGENLYSSPELGIKDVSITDYLTGAFKNIASASSVADNPNQQQALKYAKMKTSKNSQASFGDPEIKLGYRALDSEFFDCDVFMKCSIPIAKEVEPDYIFEAQIGNNGHFSLGAGLTGSAEIFKIYDFNFELIFHGELNYNFKKQQKRTLSSYTDRGVTFPWDKYVLTARIDQAIPLSPLANVLTIDVDVYPGVYGELFLASSLKYDQALFNFGWAGFFKQGESIEVFNWKDGNKYGRPSTSKYRTDQIFDPKIFPYGEIDNTGIASNELELDTPSTPGSFSNLFFLEASFATNSMIKRNVVAGAGVSYEFCNENSNVDRFSLWGKLSISF